MFIDLLDRLRCPQLHEDSWLVAAAQRTVDGRIVDGTVGCPVCGSEFAIRSGEVWFGAEEQHAGAKSEPVTDEPVRLAALLGVDARGGLYVLDGAWGALADQIAAFAPAQLLLISPPGGPTPWSTVRGAGDGLPIAAGSARGVALDRASAALARAAARALMAHGRLVAPAETPVPEGITILARDERQWVGERVPGAGESGLVTPRRAAPRTGSR